MFKLMGKNKITILGKIFFYLDIWCCETTREKPGQELCSRTPDHHENQLVVRLSAEQHKHVKLGMAAFH